MTPDQENESGKITYTVRELLAEIKSTLLNIDLKLDQKAEKQTVDSVLVRLATIETTKITELPYANQLIAEHREVQKVLGTLGNEITALKTNKKDKEAFNLLWIPIIFNGIITIIMALYIGKII